MEDEILLDTEENVLTLHSSDGDEVDFEIIATLNYDGGEYAILKPVEVVEGMEDDEALVFRVEENEDGSASYEIILDDGIIDGVFVEYNKLLDELEQNGN